MGIFSKKSEEDFDEDILEQEEPLKRKIRKINPDGVRKERKEQIKPWGVKERLFVLIVLLFTVVTSSILALTARNFKLPNLPALRMPKLSELNPFKEQVLVIGNKGSKVSQEKIENTKKLFKEVTDGHSGIYAFYIYDINGDYYYGLNYQEKMQAASLIKLPIMYSAYKSFYGGSLDPDQYKPLIESMGKRSDNSAFNTLVNKIGKEKINKAILELGMSHTSLSENITTPEEVGMFFKKLYKNELLNEEDTKELLSYMTDTIFEEWLRPGIPSNITLAHKYGRELHSVSDAGVVMNDKPFVIVIMTDGVIEREADELFPKLSKLLYDGHVGE